MFRLLNNKMIIFFTVLKCIQVSAFVEITSERLQQDKEKIKNHIFVTVKNDIDKSEDSWIKYSGVYLAQVSTKVYNSRPLPFYYDYIEEAKEIVDQEINKPKVACYVQNGVENFLEKKGKVTQQNLGDFFHNWLVDNMKFDEEKRTKFKEDPLAMNEFIKTADFSWRRRYIKKNIYNLMKHYYLTTFYKK